MRAGAELDLLIFNMLYKLGGGAVKRFPCAGPPRYGAGNLQTCVDSFQMRPELWADLPEKPRRQSPQRWLGSPLARCGPSAGPCRWRC
ncbi:hypothetical protein [Azospirillum melinis]